MIQAIVFYAFAFLCVATALVVILAQRPITSVLSLALCLFSLAGLFVLCEAYFAAAIQVIVYAGAVMVLFLFVVMLLGPQNEKRLQSKSWISCGLGALAGGLFLIQWYRATNHNTQTWLNPPASIAGTVENTGALLFTKYLLPFEVASVLLLAAIVGMIVLAKKEA